MTRKTYILVLDRWRPPLANQWRGRHFAVAHRLRRQASDLLAAYARVQGVPRATGRRGVALEVVLGPRQRRFDADAPWKLLLDAAVQAGLLLDDGPAGLAGSPTVSFRRGSAADWGCVLYLTEEGG